MSELDKFGEFFVANTRDKILENLDFLIEGKWKAPSLQGLQNSLQDFTEEQKGVIRELVDTISTGVMHDLLFAFQEASDAGERIAIHVNGKDIAQLSDGLHGEIFSDDGWIKRFSRFEYKEGQ